jgi:hypothetical protein
MHTHASEFIRTYVIKNSVFLELNTSKVLQILAFHSSFLTCLHGMLINSEIIIAGKHWKFVFYMCLYEIHAVLV